MVNEHDVLSSIKYVVDAYVENTVEVGLGFDKEMMVVHQIEEYKFNKKVDLLTIRLNSGGVLTLKVEVVHHTDNYVSVEFFLEGNVLDDDNIDLNYVVSFSGEGEKDRKKFYWAFIKMLTARFNMYITPLVNIILISNNNNFKMLRND